MLYPSDFLNFLRGMETFSSRSTIRRKYAS